MQDDKEDYPFDDDELQGDAADEFLRAAMGGGDQTAEPQEGDASGPSPGEPSPDDPADLEALLEQFADSEPASGQLAWRETYFVFFPADARPTLTQVESAIGEASGRLRIENLRADEDGLFSSVTVQSPEDNAALEIGYEQGGAVAEQSVELAKTLQGAIEGDDLALLVRSDARLELMHFERLPDPSADEPGGDPDSWSDDALLAEGLDPATLITVIEALAGLTGGLPFDPAAGEPLT